MDAPRLRKILICVVPLLGQAGVARAAPPPPFSICYNYECSRHAEVALSEAQWQEIVALFTPPAPSAQQERERVRHAVARMEGFVGAVTPAGQDLGGNVAGSGKSGQLDCIDESTNTTTYLTLFQRAGLVTWHEVAERVKRDRWIIDVHWTAVLQEKNGARYAVDSWFLDNGQPPYIQALEDWLDKKDFED
jgi:hypothetical protein